MNIFPPLPRFDKILGILLMFIHLKTGHIMRSTCLLLILAQAVLLSSQDLHFHETGGFGTDKLFGIDGEVYRVTNLNKEGEGSLRFGLEQTGPRLIVFEVGGIIDLEREDIVVREGSVTVAGQTAPWPGITLIKGGLRVRANEVLIQHLTIRPGDAGYTEPLGWEPDGFATSSSNVVFDHCSVSWAIDENMSVARGGNNVTFYRCIVAEGLSNSIHAKSEHSCGSLVMFDSKNIAIIGSLYAHNFRRNPRYVDGSAVMFANNVVYNYGIYASHVGANVGVGNPDDPGVGDFIGNAYFRGPDGWDDIILESHKGDFDKNNAPANGIAYLEDNIGLDRMTGNSLRLHDEYVTLLSKAQVRPDSFQANEAYDNIEKVLYHAGSRPGERSEEDARIVQSLIDGTGSIIDSQSEVGSYPEYPDSARALEHIPSSASLRRTWLDSISASLGSTVELDLSSLYAFIDEHLVISDQSARALSFQTHPKPASDFICFSFNLDDAETFQAYLVDMAGREIQLEHNLEGRTGYNEQHIALDGYSLAEGIYLLVLSNESRSFSEKVIFK